MHSCLKHIFTHFLAYLEPVIVFTTLDNVSGNESLWTCSYLVVYNIGQLEVVPSIVLEDVAICHSVLV